MILNTTALSNQNNTDELTEQDKRLDRNAGDPLVSFDDAAYRYEEYQAVIPKILDESKHCDKLKDNEYTYADCVNTAIAKFDRGNEEKARNKLKAIGMPDGNIDILFNSFTRFADKHALYNNKDYDKSVRLKYGGYSIDFVIMRAARFSAVDDKYVEQERLNQVNWQIDRLRENPYLRLEQNVEDRYVFCRAIFLNDRSAWFAFIAHLVS